MSVTMKAVRIHTYGGLEVLKYEDVPVPQPGTGELLVRIHAAGVNPVDWKVREGYMKDYVTHTLPLILGWDFSGVVEALGSGVTRTLKNDDVYGRPDLSRDGAYAEYIVVRESEVARKPKSVDYLQAAAVPLAGLTAWQALFDKAELKTGQKILIHAAAGGVGSFAVQFAKWKGAHVIGTASRKNQDLVRKLGAEEVVDYQKTRFEEVVRDVDVVFDTIGGETQRRSWKVLKKGGTLVSIVAVPSAQEAAAHDVRAVFFACQPNGAQLTEIARLIDAGKVRSVVDTIMPLAEARRAQELSQGGHTRGKIVLRVI